MYGGTQNSAYIAVHKWTVTQDFVYALVGDDGVYQSKSYTGLSF